MIPFLRKNAVYVVWVIVIFFGATLFSTSFFFGDTSPQKTSEYSSEEIRNAAALLDGDPIDGRRFQVYYEQLISQVDINKTGGRISPEVMEMLIYNAVMKTVQDMAILNEAKKKEVTVSKFEKKQAIESVLVQYHLKSKRALKKKLKESGISFKSFKESIYEDLVIQRYIKQLQDAVVVTDQDVDNQYMKIKVRHILIKAEELDPYDRELMAQQLYELLQNDISFEDAVLKYSEDIQTKGKRGEIGWINYGQTIPMFEEVAFGLAVNEISRPVKTSHGYHIIQLLDRKTLPKPKQIDYDKERAVLLSNKHQAAVASVVQAVITQDRIVFQWPLLRSYDLMLKGDIAGAEASYQLYGAQQSFSVVPHYLLMRLYLMSNQINKAEEEMKKGDVKIQIDEKQAFPEFYMLSAELYSRKNNKKKMNLSFDKAFELAKDNHLYVLNDMKKFFKSNNDKKRLKKVTRAISSLEKKFREVAEKRKKELEEKLAEEAGILSEDQAQ